MSSDLVRQAMARTRTSTAAAVDVELCDPGAGVDVVPLRTVLVKCSTESM